MDARERDRLTLERTALDVDATPHAALRALRGDREPFALIGRWAGGGAILGSEPLRSAPADARALDELALPPLERPAGGAGETPGEGVGGGWFGYLGFGLGRALERLPAPPPRPHPLPLAGMSWYDHVLRLDADGRWWFEALVTEGRRGALALRRAELERRLRAGAPRAGWSVSAMAPRAPGARGHLAAVADCIERIHAGEIFQANICLRLEGTLDGSPLDAFAEAAERLEPAYGAYVERRDCALLSFSPELFLERRGREVRSAPIKGTAPRVTGTGAERAGLAASAKDVAENVMIVDLMRNDLGRVCRYGSVEASARPRAEAHPGVWHLVSDVSGTLRDGVSDADLVRAAFPPGSVTGAPKIQAMKVISALEPTGREAYTGAIGFASPVAGLELNVAIRTFELRGRRLWLGAGGGVVADSSPRAELEEALGKARPLVSALGSGIELPRSAAGASPEALPAHGPRPDPARGVLETVAVRDGAAPELEAHLERMGRSTRALYGLEPPPDLAERCREAARRLPGGAGRLRVTAVPAGGELAVGLEVGKAPRPSAVTPHLLALRLAGGLGEHKWADRRGIRSVEERGRLPLLVDLGGEVLEAGSANVWIVEGGRLVTPPADGRILPGVVRGAVLRGARERGLEVGAEPIPLERLRRAEGIVLTSSLRLARAAHLGDRATAAAEDAARALRALLLAPPPAHPRPLAAASG